MRRWRIGSIIACLGLAGAGVVSFISPSPALTRYANGLLVVTFGMLCLLAASMGLLSLATKNRLLGLIGAALGASASCTYIGSLIIQAVDTRSVAPLTAASFALVVVGLVAQRWMDAMNRKE